ncbi:MAG: MATE family efflux transporter [Ruminococcaceae bacterium]|nr:MATE family efflux transporter [Oscillospiraceae bacterium]
MTQEPVGKLISRLAVPCIISMMITAIYNTADTFFVGQLNSNSATGAVGVAFSLMSIIQATGFFYGHGSGNFISRALGSQHYEGASEMAATGFCFSFLTGTLIAALGLLFLEPLALLLGSTETILPYAKSYVGIILIGAPWMASSLTLNNQLRLQGSAIYGMVGITTGGILNMILDPILIFGFELGVAGAALATIISQFISFCILLVMCSRGSNLAIHLKRARLTPTNFREISRGGLPSLGRNGLGAIASIVLNQCAGPFGDAAIAAMSVVNRAMLTATSAVTGFGQGFQPVCGFNYGAKLYHRVMEGFWFCVKVAATVLTAFSVLGFLFAPQVVAVFRNDPEVIKIGTLALRLRCITFPLMCWYIPSSMMLQTIGRTVPATFLAVSRQGIFLIPALLILTPLLDLLGVQAAQPAADIVTFLCAVPVTVKVLWEMKAMSQATSST